MSEVERILNLAQRSHRKRAVIATAVVVSICALAGVLYFATVVIGKVSVVITPTEASNSAQIAVTQGKGYVTGSRIWGLKGDMIIRISADGYETEEFSITHATWEREKVDVIMREVLATLKAVATPRLPDIRWHLNDNLVGQGDSLDMKLNSGDYRISAVHPYYVPQTSVFSVNRGERYNLDLTLKPMKGEIFITSAPGGAEVASDQEVLGRTPLNLQVEGGVHHLTVSADRYDTKTDSISVSNSSPTVKRHYELKRTLRPVSLILSPKGGVISLDDEVISVPTGKLLLPVGSQHSLRYSKQGFSTKGEKFTVNESGNSVALELKPIYGVVRIDSHPRAKIEIGGTDYGQTPQLLKIHAVEQTVALSAPGYQTQFRKFVPDENVPLEMFVTLETKSAYRLRNSPAQYSNSAGMEMKLFKTADTITVGSPRGEIDRRANEFLREVRLSRPFYAGVHEVSVEQYNKFKSPDAAGSGNRHPIVGIDWISAAKFCNWLSRQEGLEPVYLFPDGQFTGSDPSADGYRMLTEAEWEWLARKAGRVEQSIFTWGNSRTIPKNSGNLADESATGKVESYIPNYSDGAPSLSETGRFSSNPSGLHDLTGNAREWVHDAYSLRPPREGEVKDDVLDSDDSLRRTFKGSSFRSADPAELRASWRDGSDSSADDIGFRVARYLY